MIWSEVFRRLRARHDEAIASICYQAMEARRQAAEEQRTTAEDVSRQMAALYQFDEDDNAAGQTSH
ncbi:MAG: hypothetical protein AAF562_13900 [Pseudomonadota bacterium]